MGHIHKELQKQENLYGVERYSYNTSIAHLHDNLGKSGQLSPDKYRDLICTNKSQTTLISSMKTSTFSDESKCIHA